METHPELNEKYIEFAPGLYLPRYSLPWTKLMLALGDFGSMLLTIWIALSVSERSNPDREGSGYILLGPFLFVFGITYLFSGLYRYRHVNQVEELRQLIITTTMIFLTLFAFNEMMGELKYPALFFVLGWLMALGIVPLARAIVRRFCSSMGFWGEPVVIIGGGEQSTKIINYLSANTFYGLRPVAVVDGCEDSLDLKGAGMPAIPSIPLDRWLSTSASGSRIGVHTAIVVTSELPGPMQDSIHRGEHLGFSNIITISKQFNTRNFGLAPLDFGGVLGLEERHYLLNFIEVFQIRILDLLLISLSLPLLAPFFFFIMAAIKLDSKGSVFYRQRRIGKDQQEFRVVKFRTMVENADEVLVKYLEMNPELQAEWDRDHKLRDDPRITRVGKILRKLSLDELPQLWNVVTGEMSLVGPRPIVEAEIARYGERFKYYYQVLPGITGLWQVSGRNDVNYEQRVLLDEYYVRNRSIWLNLYIIIRTASAVIRRDGAY
jgi:Undecaprenyl-phosphate galactose phosphotransferase WbaP